MHSEPTLAYSTQIPTLEKRGLSMPGAVTSNQVQSVGEPHLHCIPIKPIKHQAPATVTFSPIEAKIAKKPDSTEEMEPYCKFKIGWHRGKTSVAHNEEDNPTWNDSVSLDRKHGEEFAKLKIKDKNRGVLSLREKLGEVKINLEDVAQMKRVRQWYALYKGDKLTGEVLLHINYRPQPVE